MRKIKEEGVHFQSHIDGKKLLLTPEKAIQIQETLGVDIAMALDECPPSGLTEKQTEDSLELTLRWAKRSLEGRTRAKTAIFGITQGGIFPDLRLRAAQELSEMPFDGYAVGGVSVGESKELIKEVVS